MSTIDIVFLLDGLINRILSDQKKTICCVLLIFQRTLIMLSDRIYSINLLVFRKRGELGRNLTVTYNNDTIKTGNKFTCLGIIFTTGGSFDETFKCLSGQVLKAIFKMLPSDISYYDS